MEFVQEEIISAANRIKSSKAPGPDKLPRGSINILELNKTGYLAEVLNKLLNEGRLLVG